VHIEQSIERVIEGITKTFSADYTFQYRRGAPSLYNHPELGKIILPSLGSLMGESNISAIKPQMVAEDFSYYCQKIPGFYFMLGVSNPNNPNPAPIHNPMFNPDERSISIGIKIMSHILLDFLDFQQKIKNNSS